MRGTDCVEDRFTPKCDLSLCSEGNPVDEKLESKVFLLL